MLQPVETGGILNHLDAKSVAAKDILTVGHMTVKLDVPIEACMGLMASRNFLHLPFIEADRVVGMVSIGDVVTDNIRQMSQQINYLETYIKGRGT